jgi:hypothetical protein
VGGRRKGRRKQKILNFSFLGVKISAGRWSKVLREKKIACSFVVALADAHKTSSGLKKNLLAPAKLHCVMDVHHKSYLKS